MLLVILVTNHNNFLLTTNQSGSNFFMTKHVGSTANHENCQCCLALSLKKAYSNVAHSCLFFWQFRGSLTLIFGVNFHAILPTGKVHFSWMLQHRFFNWSAPIFVCEFISLFSRKQFCCILCGHNTDGRIIQHSLKHSTMENYFLRRLQAIITDGNADGTDFHFEGSGAECRALLRHFFGDA